MSDLSRERIAELTRQALGQVCFHRGSYEIGRQEFLALLSMADRAAAADEELAQRRANYAACQGVGISARWCPVCGTCTCPIDDGDLDTPGCPVHGTMSLHCLQPIEDATP